MRKVINIKQNTPEWLEARKGKVTGSNAITLLTDGIDESIKKNASNSFSSNFWTERGHILEDEAIELYEAIYNVTVLRAGLVVNSRFHRAQCSPDGEDETNNALLEVKCLMAKNHNNEVKSPSAKYVAQANFNALICERKKALLVYYCPDDSLAPELQFMVIDVTSKAIQNNIKKKLK
jgi:hypothetical protein